MSRTTEEYRGRFDALFDRGRSAVLAGSHHRDSPPAEGGRWGMSVVLTPDDKVADRLDALTAEAMAVAGQAHWPTGNRSTVHFTVRALEGHRAHIPDDDPLATRCAEALRRAAQTSTPIRLHLSGLTLTPSGVMVCAYPAATDFAARLSAELGADAWFEQNYDRNIWYATLVHFAAAIDHPQALVTWVTHRRDTPLGDAVFDSAELVRFDHRGQHPIRVRLAGAAFAGPSPACPPCRCCSSTSTTPW